MKKISVYVVACILCMTTLFSFGGCDWLLGKAMEILAFYYADDFVIRGGEESDYGTYVLREGESYVAYFTIRREGSGEGDADVRIVVNGAENVTIRCSAVLDASGKSYADWITEGVSTESGYELNTVVDRSKIAGTGLRVIIDFSIPVGAESVSIYAEVDGTEVYLGPDIEVIAPNDLRYPAEFAFAVEDVSSLRTQVEQLIDSLAQAIENGATEEERQAIETELGNAYDTICFQTAVAEILYSANQSDESKKATFKTLNDMCIDLQSRWDMAYNDDDDIERIAGLEKENADIRLAYDEIESVFSDSKVPTYYAATVANNKEIATLNGYDDYMDYAYVVGYSRDYTPEDARTVHALVKQYIAPQLQSITTRYRNGLDKLDRDEYDQLMSLSDDAYFRLDHDYLGDYYATYDSETCDAMSGIFLKGVAYFATDDCDQTAYVTRPDDNRTPLAYFGSAYQSMDTLVHESGHYFNEVLNMVDCDTMDLWETHSQGNEMMLLAYLGNVLDADVYKMLVLDNMYSMFSIVLYATVVDVFEQTVYGGDIKADEYDSIFADICLEYGLTDSSYWRYVAITSPAYYISYATSAIAALNLYAMAMDDYEAAQESYLRLFTSNADNYSDILAEAGIADPFDSVAYVTAVAALNR